MKIIGHRGAAGLAPDNSLAGFKKALELNVDFIEFDVRTTQDHVPVLIHDESIAGRHRKIKVSSLDFSDLKARRRDLITLDNTLEVLSRKAKLIIEIKPDANVYSVLDCIVSHLQHDLRLQDIRIASFDPRILAMVRSRLPDVELVVNEAWSGVRATFRARRLGTQFITMNQRWLWRGFIRAVSKNYYLSAYTLNDPLKAQRWQQSGLYGCITDYPDRFQ